MRTRPWIVAGVVGLTLAGAGVTVASVNSPSSPANPHKVAGPAEGDVAITPQGYGVTPAGAQTTIGHLPLNAALHPDGETLLVSNDGQATQSVQLVDASTGRVRQTIPYESPESLYIGLAWSPDGTKAYASAAANSKIRVYDYAGGRLTEGKPLALPTKTPDGKAVTLFPAGLAVTPDGKRVVVADQLGNAVTSIDVATGATETTSVGHRPVWVTLSKDARTAYVSDQGGRDLTVVDVSKAVPVVRGRIAVGLHPNKSVLDATGTRLYVANADDDTVSVVDTRRARTIGRISMSPSKGAPVGSNPVALALSGDGRTLYVANSGRNSIAVVDVARRTVRGQIPTGWYPSSVTVTGDRLLVTNAKGLGAGPNDGPGHPDPTSTAKTSPQQYSGGMIDGTMSAIPYPDGRRLAAYTKQVARNNAPVRTPNDSVVPVKPGDASPITHVIYVVKENRTYDQVMGDLGKGNGDPSLTLFDDESAPNMRELARRFVLFDNFYADAEVSANGWNWVAQANSNPYSEQMWPANYSGRSPVYPSEGNAPESAAQDPANTYLWQRLDRAEKSFANFGFYVQRKGRTFVAADPVLNRATDHDYQGYDLGCPDSSGTFSPKKPDCLTPRVDRWLESLAKYTKAGEMPTVQFVRLGNDHTSGTKVGQPTPQAMVADNDYALGRLVEAVSHSPFWKNTVILGTEDDAQNGPDHVDAHRTLAWAISPYTQTGKTDSTFYSTSSMVHTLGLFAGIAPLTQFDSYATPMNRAFTSTPNVTPYDAIRPRYDMTKVNTPASPMTKESSAQRLDKEDQIDEQVFNEIIWKSVKGADSAMPAPRYAVLGDTADAEERAEAAAEANAAASGATRDEDEDDD